MSTRQNLRQDSRKLRRKDLFPRLERQRRGADLERGLEVELGDAPEESRSTLLEHDPSRGDDMGGAGMMFNGIVFP